MEFAPALGWCSGGAASKFDGRCRRKSAHAFGVQAVAFGF